MTILSFLMNTNTQARPVTDAATAATDWWTSLVASQTGHTGRRRQKLQEELHKRIVAQLDRKESLRLLAHDPDRTIDFDGLWQGSASPLLREAMETVGIRRFRDGSFGRILGHRIVWGYCLIMVVTPDEVTVQVGYNADPRTIWSG